MCLCTTSHHNSSDNISRQPTTTTMNMNTMSPPTSSSPVIIKNIGSTEEDGMISWNDITIQEDDTCYLLSIDMPNVNGKDVTITLQKNIITISGYRRCCARSTRSLSFSSTSTENSSNSSSNSSEEQYQEEDYEQQQQERSYHKRQRLVNRRLEIDATVIDIDRAIAKTWNGSLTLYAPKR